MTSVLDRQTVQPWGNPIGDALPQEIGEGTTIGQSFIAAMPGLSAIEVTLDTESLTIPQRLTLFLREAPGAASGLAVRTLEVEAGNSATSARFGFSPIPDSEGKGFYFTLEAPDAMPGQGLAAHFSRGASVEGGRAYVNDRPVPGSVRFLTYYSLSTDQRAALLLGRLADGRPGLLGTKGLYLAVGLAYITLLLPFLWLVAHAVVGREQVGA
jgi:hypothetical protein